MDDRFRLFIDGVTGHWSEGSLTGPKGMEYSSASARQVVDIVGQRSARQQSAVSNKASAEVT